MSSNADEIPGASLFSLPLARSESHAPSAVSLSSCPLTAAATVMVHRALLADPMLRKAALAPSAAVIVKVPTAEWTNPVAEAWRVMVRGTEEVPHDGDDSKPTEAPWVEFRRPGTSREETPSRGNASVQVALAEGRAVYGFSPAPDDHLPNDLLRVAELRVTLQRLDGVGLAQAIAVFCGRTASFIPDDDGARLVEPSDILLAQRPGRDPDDHLRRVLALAAARGPKVPEGPSFADLHGMDEAVRWGRDLQRDLRAYHRGEIGWADLDGGVLLAGPPGVGKTTFAKTLAAECGVPLILGSLGAWQAADDGHLGHMLRSMRSTFDTARKAAPCILFIDEADALGDRTTFTGRNRDYSTQVMACMLELLDGAIPREGVVVVAATNRPEALDPALLRPGRFEKTVFIGLPNEDALVGILRFHLGADLTGAELGPLARRAAGATGADVEFWVRGMRRRARSEGRPPCVADLEAEMPTPADEPQLSAETRWRVAVHEAGHAVVVAILRPGALVSVAVGRGSGNDEESLGGANWRAFREPDRHVTRDWVVKQVAAVLAGRAAEAILLGEVSAGAGGAHTSDLARATWLATAAVTALGLDEDERAPPPLWRGIPPHATLANFLASHPDVGAMAARIVADAYTTALQALDKHRDAVAAVAKALIRRGSLSGAEVERRLRARASGKRLGIVAEQRCGKESGTLRSSRR